LVIVVDSISFQLPITQLPISVAEEVGAAAAAAAAAVVAVEEARRLGGGAQQRLGRGALRLADVAQLVVLGGAGVEGPAEEELGDDAAERPDVDGLAEGQAEQDLGRAVVARLQVG